MVEPPPRIEDVAPKCPQCGAEMPPGVARCPQCGASAERRWLIAMILFVVLGLPAAAGGACFGFFGAISGFNAEGLPLMLFGLVLLGVFALTLRHLIRTSRRR